MTRIVQNTFDKETPASVAVIETICTIEDIDPAESASELDSILYDHVDPIALDKMVSSDTSSGTIRINFEFEAYEICVTNNGRIFVRIGASEE